MIYIEREEDYLVKYNVLFSTEKLNKVKENIINECAEVVHQSYDGINSPNPYDLLHIRNYTKRKIGRTEPNDTLFYSPQDIYHFEYDEYKDTELIKLINELLKGNLSVISEIKNYKKNQEDIIKEKERNREIREQQIRQEIIELHNEMTTADNESLIRLSSKSNKLVKELNEIQKNNEIDNSKKSDIKYHSQVIDCITFATISKIKISTIEEVNDFFTETKINVSKELSDKKLLKKIKY